MRKTVVVISLFLAIMAIVLAGCTQSQPAVQTPLPTALPADPPSAGTVNVGPSALGTIMTDAQGMTLYYFTSDVPQGRTSACTAALNCSTTWPAFYTDTVTVSSPLLDETDFSTITRADGTKQTTWYGWPLYHFSRDTRPGDVSGNGVAGKWFVLKLPEYTVMVRNTPALGSFLTDQSGKTLYFYAAENPGEVACMDTCLSNWPPFSSGPLVAPTSLKTADFAVTQRPDGIRQSLYRGRLLYYYARDTTPGDIKGEGVINAWHVANITGYVKPVPAPTAPPTTKPTIDYGSSNDSGGSSGGSSDSSSDSGGGSGY